MLMAVIGYRRRFFCQFSTTSWYHKSSGASKVQMMAWMSADWFWHFWYILDIVLCMPCAAAAQSGTGSSSALAASAAHSVPDGHGCVTINHEQIYYYGCIFSQV